MIHPIVFYTLSVFLLTGALGVVIARHPIYAVLSLVGALFALSGLFIALGAFFVAMVQILVYAGAILVLFLFVVMILNAGPEGTSRFKDRTLKIAGPLFGLILFVQIWVALRSASLSIQTPALALASGTTTAIGTLLFTTYALPFEVASILLLVGIIGAVVLGKKKL